MSYGLLAKNLNGAIQIDSTYINYVLHEHGEGVSTTYNTDRYEVIVTFSTSTIHPPLIAIKPSSSVYCGLARYTKSGSDYTGFILYSQSAIATIDWQSFIPQTSKSSATYGLRTYNNSSELVFDAEYKAMRILNINTCNPTYSSVVTLTHSSDSNAYFIMGNSGYYILITGGGALQTVISFIGMFKYISDTEVSFGGGSGRVAHMPIGSEGGGGYWPTLWTILTVKKAF
jgi:hypothetical protein